MKIQASKDVFEVERTGTPYTDKIYPVDIKKITTDGKNIFLYYLVSNTGFDLKIVHSELTEYNGGAVPNYATLVAALSGFAVTAKTVSISGDITIDAVGIKDVAGDSINPATEEKQDTLISTVTNNAVIVSGTTSTTETNAYTAGDVVGGKIEISGCARINGGSGIINWARFIVDNNNGSAHAIKDISNQKFRIHMYHEDPGSIPADDAAYQYLSANITKRIGSVDVTMKDSTATGSEVSVAMVDAINRVFKNTDAAPGTKLYAVAEALAAWNPTAGTTTFTLELGIIQF